MWHIKNPDRQKPLIQKIFENRGLNTSQQISDFLSHDRRPYYDPFLMKGMQKAVDRIRHALKKKERIIIYGDYDVDGMSGTAILLHALRKLCSVVAATTTPVAINGNNFSSARQKISYRIPHRLDDGYGLHKKFIDEFKKLNVGLVITVDCGISCAQQISYAKSLGIDVIISDHHTIPESFPHDAYAILHPLQKDCPYPFKGLTGSGVAFKLAHALLGETEHRNMIEELADLASFGTIADLGPLIDENRTIVTRGLRAFRRTKWTGLKHLKKIAKIKEDRSPLDTSVIGFHIAPRINAAGRIAHPYIALQLLLHEDEIKAENTARQLEKLNNIRKEMTEKACAEAENHVQKFGIGPVIIAKSPDWHTGILGLIAAKMSEKFNRPAFIFHDRGDFLTASVRSPQTHNVMTLLQKVSHLMENFGGHAQAAGLNIAKEKFEEFNAAIYEHAKEIPIENAPPLEIDCEIFPHELTMENADLIEKLQPFGMGNQAPLFALKNAKVIDAKPVGKNKEHLKMVIQTGDQEVDAIAFNMNRMGSENRIIDINNLTGKIINLAGALEKNSFNGSTKIQMKVIDIEK